MMTKGHISRVSSQTNRIMTALAALSLCVMMCFQFVEVVARYFLNAPIPGSQDILAFCLGMTIFAAIPEVTWTRGHISVPILSDRFRGRFRYAVSLCVLIATVCGFAAIATATFRRAGTSQLYGIVTADLELPFAPMLYVMSGFSALAAGLALILTLLFLANGGDEPGEEPAQ